MTTSGRITQLAMVCALAAAVVLTGCAEPVTPTKAVSELVLPTQVTTKPTTEHFVTKWLVLGPFTFAEADYGGEHQQAAADNAFMPDEGKLDGTQTPPEGASWQEKQFEDDAQPGRVDLDAFYAQAEHAAAYAVCWLRCAEAVADAKLLVGSDDYITVWINGKQVHSYKKERRAAEADQDTVENIALKKGYNRIVVKCVDVVLGWNFFFRLTDKDGKAIEVKPFTPPTEDPPVVK